MLRYPDSKEGRYGDRRKNYLEYPGWKKGRNNLYSDAYRGKSAEKVPVLCRWLAEGLGLPDQKAGRYFTSAYGRARKLYREAWLLKLGHWFGVPVVIHHHGAEFEDFYGTLSEKKEAICKRNSGRSGFESGAFGTVEAGAAAKSTSCKTQRYYIMRCLSRTGSRTEQM